MSKEKKKWETPKLICLYRGRPEEAVLAVCKLVIVASGPLGNSCGRKTNQNPCKDETGS